MTTSEPSVEDQILWCLIELRQMFPKSRCQIRVCAYDSGGFGVMEFDSTPKIHPHTKKRETEIWLMDVRPWNSERGIKMRGPTLSEAMSQVRAWHREQAKE